MNKSIRLAGIIVASVALMLLVAPTYRGVTSTTISLKPYIEAYRTPYEVPLLSPYTDWGMPPDEDWLTEHPTEADNPGMKLPDYAGWYRFLGANVDCDDMEAGSGMILSDGFNDDDKYEIRCYDLESGDIRWISVFEDFVTSFILLPAKGNAYALVNNTLHAYDADNGEELWKAENKAPFAWSIDAVWTLDRVPPSYGDVPVANAITILDAKSGDVRRVFDLSRLSGITSMNGLEYVGAFDYVTSSTNTGVFPSENGANTDRVAVKEGDKIRVLYLDGRETDFPSLLPAWPAAMAFGTDSILIAEYESPHAFGMPEEEINRVAENLEGVHLIVRLFSLKTEKELWRYDTKYKDWWGSGPAAYFSKNYAVIPLRPGALILDAKTGAAVREINWRGDYWSRSLGVIPSSDNMIVGISPSDEEPPALNYINLATGIKTPAYQLNSRLSSFAITPGRFIASSESYPGGDGYNGRNMHLFAINIDERGVPIKGSLKPCNLPESQAQLTKDYFATSDPLTDPVLMTRAGTAGINALAALADKAEKATPRQLDAMIALAEYLMVKQEDTSYSDSPSTILLTRLLKVDHACLAERICLWLDDESIHYLHLPLLAELAQCGGETAKAKLDITYASMFPVKHVSASPPYPVPKRMLPKETFDEEHESGYNRWSEFIAAGKTRYVAFTSDGLASGRDIYLGIDVESDGLFEEILPTGINDTSYLQLHPGGIRGVKSKGPLKLKVNGDSLLITHNVPVLETKSIDIGGVKENYYSIKDAKCETTELSLRALRVDSDSDGLTDVCENSLLLNPNMADSDGDGMQDSSDPTPNVDASKMGPLERGVQRALSYYTGVERFDYFPLEEESHPFSTFYLRLFGCSEVAYSLDAKTFGISLATVEEREAYRKLLCGFNTYSSVSVSVRTKEQWLQGTGGGDGGMEIGAWTGGEGGKMPVDMKYIVSLDFSTVGYAIALCETSGEFYPASIIQTWIS